MIPFNLPEPQSLFSPFSTPHHLPHPPPYISCTPDKDHYLLILLETLILPQCHHMRKSARMSRAQVQLVTLWLQEYKAPFPHTRTHNPPAPNTEGIHLRLVLHMEHIREFSCGTLRCRMHWSSLHELVHPPPFHHPQPAVCSHRAIGYIVKPGVVHKHSHQEQLGIAKTKTECTWSGHPRSKWRMLSGGIGCGHTPTAGTGNKVSGRDTKCTSTRGVCVWRGGGGAGEGGKSLKRFCAIECTRWQRRERLRDRLWTGCLRAEWGKQLDMIVLSNTGKFPLSDWLYFA